MTDFAKHLENFFIKYLVGELNASKHTVRSYRDSFALLLKFMNDIKTINADKIELKHINRDTVLEYLSWLEKEYDNSTSTRNQRYASIRSFCKYLQYVEPTRIFEWQNIRSIRLKKPLQRSVNYLSIEAIKLVFEQIEVNSYSARRDLAMLALLYDSGARAQEICDLTPSCLRFENPYTVRLTGKGKKQRIVPLQKEQIDHLQKYISDFRLDSPAKESSPLFFNRNGDKLTTAGLTYILKKYTDSARCINSNIIPHMISPHVLRHSKAMHLLQSGINIIYIRDFLGHKSIQTTEVYARADSKQKREAIERVYQNVLPQTNNENSWEKSKSLRDFLKSLG